MDGCDCRLTLLPLTPDDLSPEGHVCTFDLTRLKWPYLRPFAEKGKKFRLPAQASTVEQELRAGLEQYLTWALQKNQDPEAERKYRAWASAVQEECMQRWRMAQLAAEKTQGQEGYLGLSAAFTEAHTHLVFVPDDRAPHGIYAICRRLYCRSLATYLSSAEHFRVIDRPWSDILSTLKASLSNIGFECSTGLPYTYGVWKPLKRKFRFICGCHKPPPPPPAPSDAPANPEPSRSSHSKEKPAPPRVPTDKLDEALVKVLGIAMRSLRHKDTDLHQRTGLRRYWIVESPEEFARLARIHSTTLTSNPLVTADFTTMYTCFNQETMVTRIMDALKEAQAYEATRTPEVEGEQPLLLTTTGWSRRLDTGGGRAHAATHPQQLLHHQRRHCAAAGARRTHGLAPGPTGHQPRLLCGGKGLGGGNRCQRLCLPVHRRPFHCRRPPATTGTLWHGVQGHLRQPPLCGLHWCACHHQQRSAPHPSP